MLGGALGAHRAPWVVFLIGGSEVELEADRSLRALWVSAPWPCGLHSSGRASFLAASARQACSCG